MLTSHPTRLGPSKYFANPSFSSTSSRILTSSNRSSILVSSFPRSGRGPLLAVPLVAPPLPLPLLYVPRPLPPLKLVFRPLPRPEPGIPKVDCPRAMRVAYERETNTKSRVSHYLISSALLHRLSHHPTTMKLRLAAGLALSSALACAYQPRVYLLPTRGMLTGKYVVSDSAPPSLSLAQANKVLANHLGFDLFESIEDFGDGKEWQDMIGGGLDALLRTGDRPPRSTVMLVVHTDRPEGTMTLTAVASTCFFANLFSL